MAAMSWINSKIKKLSSYLGSLLLLLQAPYQQRGVYKDGLHAVLSLIGYSVGLGNFWRFPYLCYKHQGATFFIPYAVCLLIIGIPLFFMELTLGQYVGFGPTLLFKFMCPIFSGVGYGMVFIIFIIVIYYNMVMARTIFYLGSCLSMSIPVSWARCDYPHMHPNCLNSTSEGRVIAAKYYYNHIVLNLPVEGVSSDSSHEIRWTMVVSLALAWLLIALCLARGMQGTRKILLFTIFYPFLVMILIFAYSIDYMEDRDESSSYTLFQLNTTYLQNNTQVWIDAATQVIYSLGIAYGGISTIASYNTLHQNIIRDTFIVCTLDTMTSVFSTIVAFRIARHMSEDFLYTDISSMEFVFVAFPALVSKIGYWSIWAILFFLMVLALGFDTQLMMVETMTTALFDEFKTLRKFYIPTVFSLCTILFCLGIPLTMQNGNALFDMMDKYSSLHSLLLLAFLEVIIVSYIYGFRNLMKRVKEDLKMKVGCVFYYYMAINLIVLTPISLLILLYFSISDEYRTVWMKSEPVDHIFIFGIIISFSVFFIVILKALQVFFKKAIQQEWRMENMQQLWKATTNFCPEYVRNGRDPNMNNPDLPEGMFYMEQMGS